MRVGQPETPEISPEQQVLDDLSRALEFFNDHVIGQASLKVMSSDTDITLPVTSVEIRLGKKPQIILRVGKW